MADALSLWANWYIDTAGLQMHHPYWTEQTLKGMRARYPGLDLNAWDAEPVDS
jgi:hypothetical protein